MRRKMTDHATPAVRRSRLLGLALLTALLGSVAIAPAADDSRQAASYVLTEQRPGVGTSERFSFDYVNPDDPQAKPPPVRQVTTVLPRGARFDSSVPALCTASDAELIAEGGAACPPDSAIGGGVVTVDTGLPGEARIVTADVEFFNNTGEFIYVNTVRGTDARTIIRAAVERDRTITDTGMLPGVPPDGGSIDTVELEVRNVSATVGGATRNYITTPKRCRGRKGDPHWTTRVHFTYADGVTQTVPTHTPCRHAPGR
jgi:hypothetical protein